MTQVPGASKDSRSIRWASSAWLGWGLLLINGGLGIVLALMQSVVPWFLDSMGSTAASAKIQSVASIAASVLGLSIFPQTALLLLSPTIRAVARQTFAQCLRMRIAVGFAVVLIAILVVLTTQMTGDGTLTGLTKTFLAYSFGISGFLLSLVTLLLACSLISNDVRGRQIFGVATKPVARWQYVVGRWMGLMMLMSIMLAGTGVTIYAVCQYIRYQEQVDGQPVTPRDRMATESEVFTCRRSFQPEHIDPTPFVHKRLEKLQEDMPRFLSMIEEYKTAAGGDLEKAKLDIQNEITKQILSGLQTAQPFPQGINADSPDVVLAVMNQMAAQLGGAPIALSWQFKDIRSNAGMYADTAKVTDIRASENQPVVLARFDAPRAVLRRLSYGSPVKINGMDGTVEGVDESGFAASFTVTVASKEPLTKLAKGNDVTVEIAPPIQVSYELDPSSGSGEENIKCVWLGLSGPSIVAFQWRDERGRIKGTVAMPASAVDAQGNANIMFINRSPTAVTIRQDTVSLLCRVGTFETNFLRGMLLMLLQLMFLSALGVTASSFLSFPVACLVSFAALPFGLAREWIQHAVAPVMEHGEGGPDVFLIVGKWIVQAMSMLLPDLSQTSPSEAMEQGLELSWLHVGEVAYLQMVVRGLILLAVACLIFRRRELARVQV